MWGKKFKINWKIIDRGKKFNPSNRKCNLCLKEKFHIIFQPEGAGLNKRSNLFSTYRHRWQQLLEDVWGVRSFLFGIENSTHEPCNSNNFPLLLKIVIYFMLSYETILYNLKNSFSLTWKHLIFCLKLHHLAGKLCNTFVKHIYIL